MIIQVQYSKKIIPYTGKELRSHFIFHAFGLQGDAMAAFQGPCRVSLEHMVDQEDVKANAPISGERMLHFLGEFFGDDLEKTILRQRLLMACMLEHLQKKAPKIPWVRKGDDLLVGSRKLSVSIATASPISTLIHAGINLTQAGTPVPTFSLAEAKISPQEFARAVLRKFQRETREISLARAKVRAVS